jgi:PAS domain S-box-containing protein
VALFDQELRFVLVNTALAELSQRKVAAHLGRTLSDVMPEVPSELVGQLNAVVTEGTLVRHQLVTVGARQLMVDAFPVRITGDQITGVGAVIADVTERYRLEQLEREAEQLEATNRLTHRLLESQRMAQMGGFEYDIAAGRSLWSEELCRLLGLAEPPVNPGELLDFAHPDELPRLREIRRRVLASGGPFTIETRMIRADGRVREVVLHGEGLRAGDGQEADVAGVWGVLQDVTEIRSTQREMAAAQREVAATQQEMVAAQRDVAEAREIARSDRGLLELFQRAMLPAELPTVPGGTLAAEYIAVADRIDVGGDWYDAFPLPDGRIALSIGDVVGHDQQAAAIMGQLRTTSRGYAVEEPDPGSVLARLNRLLALTYPTGTLVSAIVALYDPDAATLSWANAGHPHPLLAVPGRSSGPLVSADPILGATSDRAYRTQTVALPPGSTLLCYTDGLIERRTVDLLAGQDALCELLDQVTIQPSAISAPDVVEHVTKGMNATMPPEDDVCVLVLQRFVNLT